MNMSEFYWALGRHPGSARLVWTFWHAWLLHVSLNFCRSNCKVNGSYQLCQTKLTFFPLSFSLYILVFAIFGSFSPIFLPNCVFFKVIPKFTNTKDEFRVEKTTWGLEVWRWFRLQAMKNKFEKETGSWTALYFLPRA